MGAARPPTRPSPPHDPDGPRPQRAGPGPRPRGGRRQGRPPPRPGPRRPGGRYFCGCGRRATDDSLRDLGGRQGRSPPEVRASVSPLCEMGRAASAPRSGRGRLGEAELCGKRAAATPTDAAPAPQGTRRAASAPASGPACVPGPGRPRRRARTAAGSPARLHARSHPPNPPPSRAGVREPSGSPAPTSRRFRPLPRPQAGPPSPGHAGRPQGPESARPCERGPPSPEPGPPRPWPCAVRPGAGVAAAAARPHAGRTPPPHPPASPQAAPARPGLPRPGSRGRRARPARGGRGRSGRARQRRRSGARGGAGGPGGLRPGRELGPGPQHRPARARPLSGRDCDPPAPAPAPGCELRCRPGASSAGELHSSCHVDTNCILGGMSLSGRLKRNTPRLVGGCRNPDSSIYSR